MSLPKGFLFCTITTVGSFACECEFETEKYWIIYRIKKDGRFRDHEECHTVFEAGDYVLIENRKQPGRYFESTDEGFNWRLAKTTDPWEGIYEVPQCIHTQQLEELSTTRTVVQ